VKKSDITYGQLDKVLRSFGFARRPAKQAPPGHVYEHKETGAMVLLPAFAEDDRVYEHHLVAARTELANFGLADTSLFSARLRRAAS
jgi:hypothetical protein